MMPVAFVDTNIPIYAAGLEHRYKEPCARVILAIAENPARFITDAEVLQELMHHYLRTNRWAYGREVFRRFETLLRGRVQPVYAEDVSQAALLADRTPDSSSRDLVHVAVMGRYGTDLVISTDSDFDSIPGVRRLDPMALNDWQTELDVDSPPPQ